jgi:hypothetical protein
LVHKTMSRHRVAVVLIGALFEGGTWVASDDALLRCDDDRRLLKFFSIL